MTAPAFVQSWTGTGTASPVTITVAPSAGNTLIVHFIYRPDNVTLTGVTDNLSDAFTKIYVSSTELAHYGFAAYAISNVPPGVTSVSISFTAGSCNVAAEIQEWSNLTTITDGTKFSFSPGASPQTSGSVTPTAGDSIVLFALFDMPLQGASPAPVYSSGFQNAVLSPNSTDLKYAGSASWVVSQASGSYSATVSWSNGGSAAISIYALRASPSTTNYTVEEYGQSITFGRSI